MGAPKEPKYVNGNPPTPVADPIQDGEMEETEGTELSRDIGRSLSDIARGAGITSWVAGKMATVGKWMEQEVDERRQTIGGIDNMWLLMADATDSDFNPVRTTYLSRDRAFANVMSGLRVHLHTARQTLRGHARRGMFRSVPS